MTNAGELKAFLKKVDLGLTFIAHAPHMYLIFLLVANEDRRLKAIEACSLSRGRLKFI